MASFDFVQLGNEVDDSPAHESEDASALPSAQQIVWVGNLIGLSRLSMALGNSQRFCFSQQGSIGLLTKEMVVSIQNDGGQEVMRVTHTFTQKEENNYVIVRTITTYFSRTTFCDEMGSCILESKKYPDGSIRLFCGEMVLGSIDGLFWPCGDVTIRDVSGHPKIRMRHPSCFMGRGQPYKIFDERTKIQVGQLSKGHGGQGLFALEFDNVLGLDVDIWDKGLMVAASFFVYTRFHANNSAMCCGGTWGCSWTKYLLAFLFCGLIVGVVFTITWSQI